MDRGLLSVVQGDLLSLNKDWHQDIDDNSLRISSPILYRLLVDHKLSDAASSLNIKDIQILSPLVTKSPPIDMSGLVYWQAGGAKYRGMMIQSVSYRNRELSPDDIMREYELMKDIIGKDYSEKLGVFIEQTVFIIKGMRISRGEVIKYVNNKLGGRHYDTSRNESALENKYLLLDSVRESIMLLIRIPYIMNYLVLVSV
jgi:hypothetical protein